MLNRCVIGDCREVLKQMIADGVKVQMCVTSPPYWGLRDYGTGKWEGGQPDCDHLGPPIRTREHINRNWDGGRDIKDAQNREPFRHTCGKCGAHRVDRQIGLEETPGEYVDTMVEVFRLVREVLADDGTLWINLGDSYASTPGLKTNHPQQSRNGQQGVVEPRDKHPSASRANLTALKAFDDLKPKDLIGIPWRVALALQEDGWYLRSDIIWSKPNCMPESCTDRPTRAHEYLFLLSKRARYYYDCDAVRELHSDKHHPNRLDGCVAEIQGPKGDLAREGKTGGSRPPILTKGVREYNPAGRNRRSVWTIPSSPFKDVHFATFPPKLVEPCIMAGTSEVGHCQECGKRWVRVVRMTEEYKTFLDSGKAWRDDKGKPHSLVNRQPKGAHPAQLPGKNATVGWRPTCDHGNLDPIPDIVLDPFLGSGTVARVAQDLGRDWIGVDLNSAYEPMQKHRTAQMALALGPSTAQIAV